MGPDRAGACPEPADDDHLRPIRDALPDDLSHDERTAALGFIDDWAHVFSKGEFDMRRTNLIPHRRDTEGHKPFRQPLCRGATHAFMRNLSTHRSMKCFGMTS